MRESYRARPYFCNDCGCRFSVFTLHPPKGKRMYCPLCADHIAVGKFYDPDRRKLRPQRFWTIREVRELAVAYCSPGWSIKAFAQRTNRTEQGIEAKLQRLKVDGTILERKPKTGFTAARWTPDQERELIALYETGTLSYQDIANRLGRTAKACRTRIEMLRKRSDTSSVSV